MSEYCCSCDVSELPSAFSGEIFNLYGGLPPVQVSVVCTHSEIVVVVRLIVAARAIMGAVDAAKSTNARVQGNVLENMERVRLAMLVTGGMGRVPVAPVDVGEGPPREAISKLVIARTSERSRLVTHQ